MADPFDIFNGQSKDSDFANVVGPVAAALAARALFKSKKSKLSEAEQRWANEYPIYDDDSVADIRKKIEAATINYNGHPSKSQKSKTNKQALANYIASMRGLLNDLIRAEKEAAAQAEIDRKAAAEEAKRNATEAVLTRDNTLPSGAGSGLLPTTTSGTSTLGNEVGGSTQPEEKSDNKKLLLYGGIAVGGIIVLVVLSKLLKK